MDDRYIESYFPIYTVSRKSATEKSLSHGHPNSVHYWPAPRTLSASRCTNFAALIDDIEDEEINNLIKRLSDWDNVRKKDAKSLLLAKKAIAQKWAVPPKILDPFGGKGIICLEALRLGCDIYSNDLNPVATLIQKAILEWPNKYNILITEKEKTQLKLSKEKKLLFLPYMIEKWSHYLINSIKREFGEYYTDGSKNRIMSYIWVREIKCSNPNCQNDFPLIKSFWLSKNKNKIAYKIEVNKEENEYSIKIVKDNQINFDPNKGTINYNKASCPFCLQVTDSDVLKEYGKSNLIKHIPIIKYIDTGKDKRFELIEDVDIQILAKVEQRLEKELREWNEIDTALPEETLIESSRYMTPAFYGHKKWKDIFNVRQKLILVTFFNELKIIQPLIRNDSKKILGDKYRDNVVDVIVTYLAFILDNMIVKYNNLARWEPVGKRAVSLITMNSIPMQWNYVEINPLEKVAGSYLSYLGYMLEFLEMNTFETDNTIEVIQNDASKLPYDDGEFDGVFTDPPYYSNIPYSDLSDLFYSILKRSIGSIYPEYFQTYLTPKENEIVADPLRQSNPDLFFESRLSDSFKEMYRVLKPEGIAIIVYAYKTTDGWESMLNSLVNSKFVVTASWPIHTERSARPRANFSGALNSSIYMVCRKRVREKLGFWDEIKDEITSRIEFKLKQFWKEGIIGGDFFISAIGPGMEEFSKYQRIETYSGDEVTTKKLLEHIRSVCANYIIEQLLRNGHSYSIDSESQFYLAYRWTYSNNQIEYGEAIKLSNAMGVNLDDLIYEGGTLTKSGKYVSVLGPIKRGKISNVKSLIDIIHSCLFHWERGDTEEIRLILNESKLGSSEGFWKYCQAVAESLPSGNKEKQLLEGFLIGRDRYSDYSESRDEKGKITYYFERKED